MNSLYFLLFALFSLISGIPYTKPLKNHIFQAKKSEILMETAQYTVPKRYDRKGSLYYTQGFLFKDSTTLIESAGLYGESGINYLNLNDMTVSNSVKIPNEYFGEGCTFIGDEIYQLTWQERKIFVFDANTLVQKRTEELPKGIAEGWGLTHKTVNGKTNLYITDGSDKVYIVDPETFSVTKTINIVENGQKVYYLNELEFIGDTLLANIYLTNKIVAIDLSTGNVIRTIDCTPLVKEVRQSLIFVQNGWDTSYCLNGIAYNKADKTLLVTGKKWPYIYQIELKEAL